MSSPDSKPSLASNVSLSPSQASFVYWLNGLAPILTSIMTPLSAYWTLRTKPATVIQKYNQQVNEVVRQFVSGTVGLVGYFGGGESTKALLSGLSHFQDKKDGPGLSEASKQVLMIVGGTVISFIGYAFIRPKISTELICKLLKQEDGLHVRPSAESLNVVTRKQETQAAIGPKVVSWMRLQWPQSLSKRTQRVQQRIDTAFSNGMKQVQQWVDRTLVPNGKPDLSKTAWVSAGLLTGYLGGGAAIIALLKKLFQGEQSPRTADNQLKSLTSHAKSGLSGRIGTMPFVAASQPNLYFARCTTPLAKPGTFLRIPAFRPSAPLY